MDRDVALRLDGMLTAAIGHLHVIARYMKNNLTDEGFNSVIARIGDAMGAPNDFSSGLHAEHPDITPGS